MNEYEYRFFSQKKGCIFFFKIIPTKKNNKAIINHGFETNKRKVYKDIYF
jgi:hypothetical protein